MSTSDPRASTTLRSYLGLLRRRKWIVIATVVVAVAAMVAYIAHKTPIYQADASIQLTPQISTAVLQANNASASANSTLVDVPTAIQVIQSQAVAKRVSARIPGAPPVLVSQVGTTNVVSLAVRSTDPPLAARSVNAYAQQYIALEQAATSAALNHAQQVLQSRIRSLQASITAAQTQLTHVSGPSAQTLSGQLSSLEETQITLRQQLTTYETAAALSTGGGNVIATATVPTSPVLPKPVEYIVLAIVVGLLVGLALAFVADNLDDRIRSLDDLNETLGGIPPLGVIPVFDKGSGLAAGDPHSPAAEAYRMLRSSVNFLQVSRGAHIVQFTSPRPGDGKTTTLANLAVLMAQAGKTVIVVDGDLRKPRVHDAFELANDVGLTSVLLGETDIDDALKSVPDLPNLKVLTSGPVPPFPSELLSIPSVGDLFQALQRVADVVLVDSPPVLPVADATVLASEVDAVIMIGSLGVSSRRDVAAALAAEERVHAPVRGFVLNRARPARGSYYYYGSDPKTSAHASRNGQRSQQLPTQSSIER